MSINTFKGCWNNLLIGLKTRYPNAKIGMILANNWSENLGLKSENTITNNIKREMTQWQKIQCQKLNIPVFDPVEDIRNFHYHYVLYPSPTQVDVRTLELDWYDSTKVDIGTEQTYYDAYHANPIGWVFQTQYLDDTHHLTKKGAMLFSFACENWMKTVLVLE